MKRIIALMLCAVLMLSGCAVERKTEPTQKVQELTNRIPEPTDGIPDHTAGASVIVSPQTGQYLESLFLADVPGQKNALLLSVRSDGTVDYIFSGQQEPILSMKEAGYQYYTVAPDGTYTRQDESWIDQLDAMMEENRPQDPDVGTGWYLRFFGCEGNVLISCKLVGETETEAVLYHLKDGVLRQIPLQRAIERNGVIHIMTPDAYSDFHLMEDAFYARVYGGDTQVKGDEVVTIPDTYYKFSYDGTLLAQYDYSDEAFYFNLDVKNGIGWFSEDSRRQIRAVPMEDQSSYQEAVREEGSIICASARPDGSGLYVLGKSYDAEAIRLEYFDESHAGALISDTTRYALGDPGQTPSMIAAANDGTFYTWAKGTDNGALRQYRSNPQGAREPSSCLTVYSLEDNHTVRSAVSLWNQTHPDTLCEYIVATREAGVSALTQEDLITQLNTQLVNGEGPDVLILDGLPMDTLMDQGFLAPLEELDTTGVFPNLLERFTLDGTLYAIPGKMTPYLLGRAARTTEPVEALEAFADLVERKTGKLHCGFGGESKVTWEQWVKDRQASLYYVQFADQVFDLWYPSWSDAIWNGYSFDKELYGQLLTHTGRLVEHYSLETVDQLIKEFGEFPKAGLTKTDYTIINETDHPSESKLYCLAANSYVGLQNFNLPGGMGSGEPVPYEIGGIPGPDGRGATIPTAIGAVRAGGNQALGLEFLELMLSDRVQTALPYYGIYASDGYSVKGSCIPILLGLSDEAFGFQSEIVNDFEAALTDLRCVVVDETLYNASREAALQYYEGNLTLEEAIRQVEQDTAIYLAERQP